jgi:hypothetical protein
MFTCIWLETFRERLTLENAMAKNETTQTGAENGSSCSTDESRSSSRWCRYW